MIFSNFDQKRGSKKVIFIQKWFFLKACNMKTITPIGLIQKLVQSIWRLDHILFSNLYPILFSLNTIIFQK